MYLSQPCHVHSGLGLIKMGWGWNLEYYFWLGSNFRTKTAKGSLEKVQLFEEFSATFRAFAAAVAEAGTPWRITDEESFFVQVLCNV